MKVVTRNVYYCEHCGRHRLTRSSIEKHEPKCIYNPARSACGWHTGRPGAPSDFAAVLKTNPDLEWLRDQMDGCPACMLAVVVQADLDLFGREEVGFNYQDEVARFRAAENEEARADVW